MRSHLTINTLAFYTFISNLYTRILQPRIQHPSHNNQNTSLECRTRVTQQLYKVRLEPRSRLRRGLKRIGETTVRIISDSSSIRSTVTLTTGLDPDVCVEEWVISHGAGTDTEAGADDVAPVAPGLLLGRLDAVATCSICVSTSDESRVQICGTYQCR
jgi:hypothetical protein